MLVSVKGLVAIVALIALACLASSVLKLYLGLLCICLLVSFSVVGFVAWLFERLAAKRVPTNDGTLARHVGRAPRVEDTKRLSVPTVERTDTLGARAHAMRYRTGASGEFDKDSLIL